MIAMAAMIIRRTKTIGAAHPSARGAKIWAFCSRVFMHARLGQVLSMFLLAASPAYANTKEPIVLVVAMVDGSVEIENQRFTNLEALKAKIAEILKRSPKPRIEVTEEAEEYVDKRNGKMIGGRIGSKEARQLIHDAGLSTN